MWCESFQKYEPRIDLAYTARDQLASVTRYSDLAGTTKVGTSSMAYDADMRLTTIQFLSATNTVLDTFGYGFDLADRLVTETTNGATVTYQYDATNQLTSDGTRTYSFDANGNRTNSGYTTTAGNQLQTDGVWNFTYDNEGNLTKAVRIADNLTWYYGYDDANRMTSAIERQTDGGTLLMQATYLYDALGHRVEKDVWTASTGTTVLRMVYDDPSPSGPDAGSEGQSDGAEIWGDASSANNLVMRYIRGPAADQLFARIGASVAWYLTDHLGSVRNLTDNSGNLIDTLSYDAFGNVLSESNATAGDRYKYTGRELDFETNLQYNLDRYYDSVHGR